MPEWWWKFSPRMCTRPSRQATTSRSFVTGPAPMPLGCWGSDLLAGSGGRAPPSEHRQGARGTLRCSWCGHQKTPGLSTLRCPGPVVNQRLASPLDQATTVARRRRCSIIASTPATSERALPPVAGSISGTDVRETEDGSGVNSADDPVTNPRGFE